MRARQQKRPPTPTVEAGRFTLRPLRREDTAQIFPTLSDEAQMRWWSRGPFTSQAELEDWLFDPDWPGRSWVAVPSGGGPVVARLVAGSPNDDEVSEIGYITMAGHQGQGVATQCVGALVRHLIETEGQHRIFADVDPDNDASNALMKRLGFTLEGRLRHAMKTHIGWRDSNIWGLLAGELQ